MASVNPVAEETYWRSNYARRPYVKGASYDDYGPDYQHGINAHRKHLGPAFEDVKSDLGRDWLSKRSNSSLEWDCAMKM